MQTYKYYVRTVVEELYCEKCGGNHVVKLPYTLTTNPPLYDYQCVTCGNKERSSKIFPHISYEREQI